MMQWVNLTITPCRKKMLEAWETAEWSTREAQIQALQEEQLQAFQAEVVAQDGRVSATPLMCVVQPIYILVVLVLLQHACSGL
jgi:hypothetical protein